LKRVLVTGLRNSKTRPFTHRPITDKQRRWTLFFLVIVPYLKNKLDTLYRDLVPLSNFSMVNLERELGEDDPSVQVRQSLFSTLTGKNSTSSKIRRFLLRLFAYGYPFFNAAYEGSFFVYQLLYLYEFIIYYSPFHHIQGVTLKRLSQEEMVITVNFLIKNKRKHKARKMFKGVKKDFAPFVEDLFLPFGDFWCIITI
jgi:hypothetical protein